MQIFEETRLFFIKIRIVVHNNVGLKCTYTYIYIINHNKQRVLRMLVRKDRIYIERCKRHQYPYR